MFANPKGREGWPGRRWRILAWLAVGVILLLPLLAMQFTDEVLWSPLDFVVAGALLIGAGLLYELGAKHATTSGYRVAVAIALATLLLLIWTNLAVGLIGTENDPANLMYMGVLALGVIGAVSARGRPRGMAWALLATAVAQAGVTAIALITGWGAPQSGPIEIIVVNGFFVMMFGASSWMFRRADRRNPMRGAA